RPAPGEGRPGGLLRTAAESGGAGFPGPGRLAPQCAGGPGRGGRRTAGARPPGPGARAGHAAGPLCAARQVASLGRNGNLGRRTPDPGGAQIVQGQAWIAKAAVTLWLSICKPGALVNLLLTGSSGVSQFFPLLVFGGSGSASAGSPPSAAWPWASSWCPAPC